MKVVHALTQPDEYIGLLVRNPAHPGDVPISHPLGYGARTIPRLESKPVFRQELSNSVKREGFRNPVIAHAVQEGLVLAFGHSRWQIASDEDIALPALVADWCGRYEGFPVVTEQNYRQFFVDVPRRITFDETGVDYSYNLARRDQHNVDPAGLRFVKTRAVLDEFSQIPNKDQLWQSIRNGSS